MFYHVKSCQSCFMLSRPENIIRKIGVFLHLLQTMSGFSSTALGRPTTHQQRTTCECPWSQSGDLWIQARTVWQDHLWSHFMLLQYHNRWRPKKVYSINYTHILQHKSDILVLHILSVEKNARRKWWNPLPPWWRIVFLAVKSWEFNRLKKNKRRDVRNQMLQMKRYIRMCIQYIYMWMYADVSMICVYTWYVYKYIYICICYFAFLHICTYVCT